MEKISFIESTDMKLARI